ncbi:MAG TPA: hypothetical protein VH482_10170, partial [Thermomicrobiales bacterium]
GEGIGPMALRLGDGRRIYETTGDDYRRLGGRDFPMWYETADDIDRWNRIMADAVDFYVLNQSFDAGGDTVVYGTYLYRYGSVESAAKRMQRHLDQTEPDPGFAHYEILDLGTFGDESLASLETTADGSIAMAAVTARVGTLVVQMLVQTDSPPSPATLKALMAAQIACIGNGGCTRAISYPARKAA